MSKPFFLKSGANSKARQSPLSSDFEESYIYTFPKQGIHQTDLDMESVSDSDASSWINMGDIEASSPSSSTPRSLSPLSSLSGSGDGHHTNRAFDFPNEPLGVTHYRSVRSPVLRPSTSLLEVSIANLPPESELKQCLVTIREQMALSLVRLKELEEQVKNVPTLQVRISVLQEEKRQLIKQLQSKSARKRTRSAEYSGYSNIMHSRGSKSDTENDDDDYSLLKKRLRVKLNSVGVGDYSVNDACSCSSTSLMAKGVPLKSVCVGTDNDLNNLLPNTEAKKQETRSVGVTTDDYSAPCVDNKNNLLPHAQANKPKTRSIGVGMMRSFTKDVGIGEGSALLFTEPRGVQASVEKKDSSCDPPLVVTADAAISAKPLLQSTGTNTGLLSSGNPLNRDTGIKYSERKPSVGVQTSGSSGVTMVSIGVGICTIDDEPVCRKCSNRKSRTILKTVDEIMANRIDIPFCKSVGVGNMSLDDNYLCNRCSNLETRTIGVGEKIELRNIALGDFSISEEQLCDRCSNIKRRSVGCGSQQIPTKETGVGEEKITDYLLCDRCLNLKTTSTGAGDYQMEENDFVCEVCSKKQSNTENITERIVTAENKFQLESAALNSYITAEEEVAPIRRKSSLKNSTRTIGVGSCGVMDSFCSKCDNMHTRSIGVGNGNVCTDVICDRCANKKTKSVGTVCEIVETRSLGVSECCVTDNFCDRCMNIRTQTVAIGDCCVTDSFCERCFNVQMHSVGVGDFDINIDDNQEVIQANLVSVNNNTKFDSNMNIKANGTITGQNIVRHLQSKQHSVYSKDVSDGIGLKTGHNHSKESDLNESDGSIDNDNPSSDSASQTSEVLDTSQSPNRIRITDEVIVACKLLNGHLYKGKEIGREQMISCMSTVENNWFRCVSSRDCDSELIKGLLKIFRNQIHMLLETIINLVDNNGNNALHYAVSFRNWKVVDVLLGTGIMNLNLPNKAGYTPIMMAALAGVTKEDDKEIARKMFLSGDVNKQVDDTGQSPLMLAVSRGRMEMVEICLEAGADINATDDDGSTALMCACEHGHLNIAKRLLLEPECDPSMEDNEGSTALSIAMQRNFKDLALLIYGNVSFDPVGKPRKKLPGLPCKAS